MKILPNKADGNTNKDGRLHNYISGLNHKQYETLSPQEERVILNLYLQDDPSAREILIKRNLRYVIYVAKAYQNSWYSVSDLVSSGNLGLIKGVQKLKTKFDSTKYTRLVNFLSYYIQGAIVEFLYYNSNIIRLPFSVISMKKKITVLQEKYLKETTWDMPDDILVEEMAENEGYSQSSVYEFLSHPKGLVTTSDVKRGKSNPETLTETQESYENIIPCEDSHKADSGLLKNSLTSEVERVLDYMFRKRERDILKTFFGLEGGADNMKQIELEYDLTHERLRQIKDKAIQRLRMSSATSLLRPYL